MKTSTFAKLLATIFVLAVSSGAGAQTKLKWGHVYEPAEPFHRWAVWAADEIRKRSAGKYEIEVYPSSQLGRDNDLIQGLTIGSVDMTLSGSSFFAKAFPRIGVTYYPYTFRDADHLLAYAKSDIFRELVDGNVAKSGHHILSMSYYGVRHTTSNRAFANCAQMKGIKIRVPDVPLYQAMPKSCGANPAPIAFAEVYLALQNGTVDAQENPLTTIEAKKFYEVQKNVILTGHIVDHVNSVVSDRLWKKLTEEERKMFTEVLQQASAKASAEIVAREKELIAEFRKRGLNIIQVDAADFRDAVVRNIPLEQFGFLKSDWDRIQAIK